MLNFFCSAQPTPTTTAPQTFNPIGTFFPFIIMIAIFYFLIILPQNKKKKEHQTMLDNLKKDDIVVTVGGIHGTVVEVKDGIVILQIASNVKVEFSKGAISYLEKYPIKDASQISS
ncbi:MAG: preprotein translocase subunit YajC [bacterium]